jgi:hypothetical protein
MRVTDMVREMIPRFTGAKLTPEERRIAVYLRGNEDLFEALTDLIRLRIGRRGNLPAPSDPVECKAWLEMDRELRWLLGRLDAIHHSPVAEPVDQGEQPA